ncbi:MAG TPA: elongation factor G [Candidatus Omnitrophica bacterium]|nr:MAG: elongation factor G [Candidatus Omnitrophota bacterium]RKY43766.1 MAG: elongation factor G [Candidatus Omnitrophota bacterium]HEC69098.1 elongation factor G [Candidatus Omnitrophota bacterium]
MKEDIKRLQTIRNIGFIAHIDAGKTTTTERVLFYTGRVHRIGEVDEGTATTDWMPQEKERGITITSAATYCKWGNYQINIIDTPGHVDFTAEVERSLKVLDGAVVILCAQGGVEPQSETVWRQADKYEVPRIVFVNKMDKVGADLFNCEKEIEEKLGAVPLVMQLPIYKDSQFVGIIDLLKEKAVYYEDEAGTKYSYQEIPEDLISLTKKYREKMIEKLSERDDSVMERFIEGKQIPEAKLIDSIRKLTLSRQIFPVFCGSALKNKGVQLLLDGVCRYLPSPLDRPLVSVFDQEGNKREIEIIKGSFFCGLCFKVAVDPYVGKLNYVRIYSGKIKSGSYLYNSTKKIRERVNKIVRMHANKQELIEEAFGGEIVCLVGLKDTTTGDTLCEEGKTLLLEKIHFPEPVISQAIEPVSRKDQDKLSLALAKLAEEDPTFRVFYNSETGQTIISGMGKLHLEIVVDKLKRFFGIETSVGKPQVAFRETITKKVIAKGEFIQQTGGRGHFARVVLSLEPQDSLGIDFESKIKGGLIPQNFIPAVKKGVEEASLSGVLGGYPVTNVKVTLIDGAYHEVDSSDLDFQVAGNIAFTEGLKQANSVLLEPIMKLEVLVALEYLSPVLGDLNSKRAKIISIKDKANVKLIQAYVPLREVFDYADNLRNLTQGRGSYSMEPAFYERVPEEILHRVLGV